MHKTFLIVCVLLLAVCAAFAQTAAPPVATDYANIGAIGVSYGSEFAGTGIYARKLADTGTYSFTVLDAVPASYRPFTVTTQVATGIAQKFATIGKVGLYIPAAAGVSWAGSNTGWGWTTGGLASIPIGRYFLMPNIRVVKSSVNNNSGYQLIGGIVFGLGWN